MYFASKEALIFDIFTNHILYQGIFAATYTAFLYGTHQNVEIKKTNKTELAHRVSVKAWELAKIRIQLSAVSILFDIWIP